MGSLVLFYWPVALRQGEREKIFSALRVTDDPESLTQFGLLLVLGEFSLADFPEGQRDAAVTQLANWYGEDPSSTIHGASGWLLRHWQQTDVARKVDETPLAYSPQREWFTLAIPGGDQTFFQTYVVIPPGEYEIGSPGNEPG